MIDLHLHILADIDDGPGDRIESLAMLDLAAALGYSTLVATPHFPDPQSASWERVEEELAWLTPEAETRGISLRQGYEIRIHPDLPAWLRGTIPMSIAQTKTLLIELPFAGWPTYTERVLFDVMVLGYRVLLAHPERYESVMASPEVLEPLRDRGVMMQLTTGSLGGLFGKRSKALSELLLRNGMIDVLSSDAHSAGRRSVAVSDGLARARELVGDAAVQRLTITNPAAILADADLADSIGAVANRPNETGWKQSISRVRHLIPGR